MRVEVELFDVIDVGNTLGEGVLWRASDQTVWWTDIQESKLFRLSWPGGALQTFNLPERLGSFGFVSGDDITLICAFASGFALFKPAIGELDWISRPSDLAEGLRLNDGRVAPDGTFWAGSMVETEHGHESRAGFYRLSEGVASLMFNGFRISNGIAWSPLGDELYFADSARQTIFRSSYPPLSFEVSEQEVFAKLTAGAPDGAVTDRAGRYWSAIWGEAQLNCYLPDGELLQAVEVPAKQPTCLAFGGSDENLMFVTSAREGLSEAELEQFPKSGSLFVYKSNTCGSRAYRYML